MSFYFADNFQDANNDKLPTQSTDYVRACNESGSLHCVSVSGLCGLTGAFNTSAFRLSGTPSSSGKICTFSDNGGAQAIATGDFILADLVLSATAQTGIGFFADPTAPFASGDVYLTVTQALSALGTLTAGEWLDLTDTLSLTIAQPGSNTIIRLLIWVRSVSGGEADVEFWAQALCLGEQPAGRDWWPVSRRTVPITGTHHRGFAAYADTTITPVATYLHRLVAGNDEDEYDPMANRCRTQIVHTSAIDDDPAGVSRFVSAGHNDSTAVVDYADRTLFFSRDSRAEVFGGAVLRLYKAVDAGRSVWTEITDGGEPILDSPERSPLTIAYSGAAAVATAQFRYKNATTNQLTLEIKIDAATYTLDLGTGVVASRNLDHATADYSLKNWIESQDAGLTATVDADYQYMAACWAQVTEALDIKTSPQTFIFEEGLHNICVQAYDDVIVLWANIYTSWPRTGGGDLTVRRALRVSQDRGETWSAAVYVGDGTDLIDDLPVPFSSVAWRDDEGTLHWMFALYSTGFETWTSTAEVPDAAEDWTQSDVLLTPVTEPVLVRLNDGTLCIFTGNIGSARHVGLSYSTDNGATWSEPIMLDGTGGKSYVGTNINLVMAFTYAGYVFIVHEWARAAGTRYLLAIYRSTEVATAENIATLTYRPYLDPLSTSVSWCSYYHIAPRGNGLTIAYASQKHCYLWRDTEALRNLAGSDCCDLVSIATNARDSRIAAEAVQEALSAMRAIYTDARFLEIAKDVAGLDGAAMPADGDFLSAAQKAELTAAAADAAEIVADYAKTGEAAAASSQGEAAAAAAAIANYGDEHWATATSTTASNMPADGDFLSAAQKAELTAAAADAATAKTQTADIYWPKITYRRDQDNAQDEYEIVWYKNATPVTSGITLPTLSVVSRATEATLIDAETMTQVGTPGGYKYDATGDARLTVGDAGLVIAAATIDGTERTGREWVGRDSS